VGAKLYVYSPSGQPGLDRSDLEAVLEEFFDGAAEDVGAGSGQAGFNLDYELREGEVPQMWADRHRDFLRSIGVCPGTVLEVFADGWEPEQAWCRVEVFGEDRWLTEHRS
jgi:hypothetical protein